MLIKLLFIRECTLSNSEWSFRLLNVFGDYKFISYQIAALLVLSIFLLVVAQFSKSTKKNGQVQSESEGLSEKDLFRQLVNIIPFSACVVNKFGYIEKVNHNFEALTDRLESVLIGHKWYRYLDVYENIEQLNEFDDLSFNLRGKNKVLYKITYKAIYLPGFDNQYYFVLVEDITHLQVQLMNLNQRIVEFKGIMDGSCVAILIEDVNGHILLANKAACKLLEYDNRNLKNKSVISFIPDRFHQYFSEKIDLLINHEGQRFMSYLTASSGKIVPVHISVSKVNFFGTKGQVYIIEDNSEWVEREIELRYAQQKAQEADVLKSSFLSNMSHEIRTPMNSIMGFSLMMCDETISNNERLEYHSIVKMSAENLLTLVDDIMELSKIQSGLVKFSNAFIDFEKLCSDISVYVTNLLKSKTNIKFFFNESSAANLSLLVESDVIRVMQVLKYLLNNAVKFTEAGSIVFSFSLRNDDTVDFCIKDSGIGIPKHKLPIVFHKFRQAQEENNRDFGGAGIGLSISILLSKMLGGYIWAKSKFEEGTDFHFVLPSSPINALKKKGVVKTILIYSINSRYVHHEELLRDYNILYAFSKEELLGIPIANDVEAVILTAILPNDIFMELNEVVKEKPIYQYSDLTGVIVHEASNVSYNINKADEAQRFIEMFECPQLDLV